MPRSNPPLLILLVFFSLIAMAAAVQHNVGDKAGWKLPEAAKLNYTDWASQFTFHVEDTLHFRYDKSSDNVLQVKPADYDSCSNSTPIHAYSDGDTVVYLLRDGGYWFISGTPQHCSSGQKFSVRVLPHQTPAHKDGREGEAPAPKQFFSFRGAATKIPVSSLPPALASAHAARTSIHGLLLVGLLVCSM